MQEIYFCFR